MATGNTGYASQVTRLNWAPSLILIAGVLLFVASVGASGWIASRRLGVLTGLVAVAGSIALLLMLWVFGDVAWRAGVGERSHADPSTHRSPPGRARHTTAGRDRNGDLALVTLNSDANGARSCGS